LEAVQAARASSEFEVELTRRRLGKYELVAQLGSGGMAEVHLARLCGPMGFQKIVVLKTVHEHLGKRPEFIKMFLDEARISALLKHPRVIDIYDLGYTDGTYYIAMEHLVGQPLLRVIATSARTVPLDVYGVTRIVADTAEGLDAAHELTSMTGEPLELVHRDVSPGNIMVLYDGNVKILDFGIAKARGRISESGVHAFKGKLGYVAPEQLVGGQVDRRSDIFGLGVVMWEALTVRRLFRSGEVLGARAWHALIDGGLPPPSTYRPQVPPSLDEICLIATAADPRDRYQTAAEMREALEQVLRGPEATGAREAIAGFMSGRFGRRRLAWERAIRKVASTAALEELDVDVDFDDTDAPDSEPGGEGEDRDSTGDLTPQVVATERSRSFAGIVTVLLLVALGGAGLYLTRAWADGAAGDASSSSARHVRGAKPAPAGETATSAPVRAASSFSPAPVAADGVLRDEGNAQPDEETGASDDAGDEASAERDADASAPAREKKPTTKTGGQSARALASETESAEDLVKEAGRLYMAGRLSSAKALYKRAIRRRPKYAPAHRGLGLVYEKLGNSAKAVQAFNAYLRVAPNAADAPSIRTRIARLR